MKIIQLDNDTYQVWDYDETTCYFQGNIQDCRAYILEVDNDRY